MEVVRLLVETYQWTRRRNCNLQDLRGGMNCKAEIPPSRLTRISAAGIHSCDEMRGTHPTLVLILTLYRDGRSSEQGHPAPKFTSMPLWSLAAKMIFLSLLPFGIRLISQLPALFDFPRTRGTWITDLLSSLGTFIDTVRRGRDVTRHGSAKSAAANIRVVFPVPVILGPIQEDQFV